MEFEWDDAKDRSNLAKHGFSFEDAEQVLAGHCLTFRDTRLDYCERPLRGIGAAFRAACRHCLCDPR